MSLFIRKLRYRLNLPAKIQVNRIKPVNNTSNNASLVLSIILTASIIVFIFSYIDREMKPVITTIAESKARGIALAAVNSAVIENADELGIHYEELSSVDKNASGDIVSIRTNTNAVNEIKSKLMQLLQDKLNVINNRDIEIPLGNLLRTDILAGRGPRIPVKLLTLGKAEVDIINSFKAEGINQTKHEIHLKVKTDISVILPTGNIKTEVITQIPITESIIVGNVPNTYANIDTFSKNR